MVVASRDQELSFMSCLLVRPSVRIAVIPFILLMTFSCKSAPVATSKIPKGQTAIAYVASLNDRLAIITALGYPSGSSIQSIAVRNQWLVKARPILEEIHRQVPHGFAMFVVGHTAKKSYYPKKDLLVSKYRALFMFRYLQREKVKAKKMMVTGAGLENPANKLNLADPINDRVTFEVRPTIIDNGKFKLDWSTK